MGCIRECSRVKAKRGENLYVNRLAIRLDRGEGGLLGACKKPAEPFGFDGSGGHKGRVDLQAARLLQAAITDL